MGIDNWPVDKTGEAAAGIPGSSKSNGFKHAKNMIADTMHNVAGALAEKAANREAASGMARYGKQASEWMDQSAEYVRQFDYKREDARVREYVRQSPGRSLLIAGAVGLIVGAIWRRR
jgi:ElaB/YqjD/DUF883 family membrane-anchored ribosome-binding protein